jgi:hypothetical protein
MRDTTFIANLREAPSEIELKEFEEKVVLDYVNIQNYDLLAERGLASTILAKIIELQPEVSSLQNTTLLNCDLSDSHFTEQISRIYSSFSSIYGLWVTGMSKIVHLLNDKLFVMLDLSIAEGFGLLEDSTNLIAWFGLAQQNAQEVIKDFQERGFSGSPEQLLSSEIGYTSYGCEKSLVKFLDEYFWLRYGDNLPIPPTWIPPS